MPENFEKTLKKLQRKIPKMTKSLSDEEDNMVGHQEVQQVQQVQQTGISPSVEQFQFGPNSPTLRKIDGQFVVFINNKDHILLILVGTPFIATCNLSTCPFFIDLNLFYKFLSTCPEKNIHYDEKNKTLVFKFCSECSGLSVSVPISFHSSDQLDQVMRRGWNKVGTLSDLLHLFLKYPREAFEYGVLYNDVIHPVIINKWNQGFRVSTIHPYPMGDAANGLRFGRSIFTYGLKNQDPDVWTHYYYYESQQIASTGNGNSNHIEVFVKNF